MKTGSQIRRRIEFEMPQSENQMFFIYRVSQVC